MSSSNGPVLKQPQQTQMAQPAKTSDCSDPSFAAPSFPSPTHLDSSAELLESKLPGNDESSSANDEMFLPPENLPQDKKECLQQQSGLSRAQTTLPEDELTYQPQSPDSPEARSRKESATSEGCGDTRSSQWTKVTLHEKTSTNPHGNPETTTNGYRPLKSSTELVTEQTCQEGDLPTNDSLLEFCENEFGDNEPGGSSPMAISRSNSDIVRPFENAKNELSKSPQTLFNEEMVSKTPLYSSGSLPPKPMEHVEVDRRLNNGDSSSALAPPSEAPVDTDINSDSFPLPSPNSSSISPPASEQAMGEPPNLEEKQAVLTEKLKRIRTDVQAVDKLKIALYMEGMRVHKGKGADRLYADYWDALGRYLSSRDYSIRSSDDAATNGVEGILRSFLKTKKLKKLHNAYVKALMKQSLLPEASRIRISDHVPVKWRKRVRDASKVAFAVDTDTTTNSTTVDKSVSPQQMLNLDDTRSLEQEFSTHSIAFQNTGRNDAFASILSKATEMNDAANSTTSITSTVDSNADRMHELLDARSSRIPGTLEIDQISHFITKKEGYCLSQSAQWITAIAVRDYLSYILQQTMNHFNEEEKNASSTTSSDSTNATNGRKRKRRRLTNYDFVKALGPILSKGPDHRKDGGVKLSLPNTRMAWEHIVSHSCLSVGATPRLENIQNEINRLIDEGIDRYENNQQHQHQRSNVIDNNNNQAVDSRRGSLNGGGNGLGAKDLSTMVSRRLSNVSVGTGMSRPTSQESAKGIDVGGTGDAAANLLPFGIIPGSVSTSRSQLDQSSLIGQASSSVAMGGMGVGVGVDVGMNMGMLTTTAQPGEILANGENIDAEQMYNLMRRRGSFLSIGTNLSRLSTPDGTKTDISVSGSLMNGEGSAAAVVGGFHQSLQDLSSASKSAEALSKGMRRLSSSNGRGRGAKDLSAMLARNSAK